MQSHPVSPLCCDIAYAIRQYPVRPSDTHYDIAIGFLIFFYGLIQLIELSNSSSFLSLIPTT